MTRRLPVLFVTAAAAVSLAACGSDSSDSGSSPTPTSSSPTTADTSSAATSASSASSASSTAVPSSEAASGTPTPVKVNKTITDPVLGNKTVVLQYIDGYQPSAAAKARFSALADEKVVLVQVKATAGTKYYGGVDTGDYRLTKTSNDIDVTSTTILDDEVTKAGFPVLEDVDTGKTGTGWVVFTPKKDYSKLVFAYKRLAYRTSNGGSIKEQVFPLPLN